MSNSMPIASPVRTQAIVNRYFMHAKKNLGQNFLVDLPAIKGIVAIRRFQRTDLYLSPQGHTVPSKCLQMAGGSMPGCRCSLSPRMK